MSVAAHSARNFSRRPAEHRGGHLPDTCPPVRLWAGSPEVVVGHDKWCSLPRASAPPVRRSVSMLVSESPSASPPRTAGSHRPGRRSCREIDTNAAGQFGGAGDVHAGAVVERVRTWTVHQAAVAAALKVVISHPIEDGMDNVSHIQIGYRMANREIIEGTAKALLSRRGLTNRRGRHPDKALMAALLPQRRRIHESGRCADANQRTTIARQPLRREGSRAGPARCTSRQPAPGGSNPLEREPRPRSNVGERPAGNLAAALTGLVWNPLGRLLGRRSSRDDGAFQRSEALVYLGEGDFDGAQPRVEPVHA